VTQQITIGVAADTAGRPLGRATAPLTQMSSTPNAAGTGP
jgi:hypothetical protein